MLWAVLLECSLLLQLPFSILLIPSATLSQYPATQQISEKHSRFSQPTLCSEEQVFQISTLRQGQPQWNICLHILWTLPLVMGCRWNSAPGKWDPGSVSAPDTSMTASSPAGSLWLLLWEILPPILAYLRNGLAHRHLGFAWGRQLLDTCSEEQNSQGFYHCHLKTERDAWQNPLSSSSFAGNWTHDPVPHHQAVVPSCAFCLGNRGEASTSGLAGALENICSSPHYPSSF